MSNINFALLLLLSFSTVAEQCVISHKEINSLSQKNKPLISAEHWVNKPGGIVFSIKLPMKIEGKSLVGVSVEKECLKENCLAYDFDLSPRYNEGDFHFVVFSGSNTVFIDAYIIITYDTRGSCEPYMKYKVSELTNQNHEQTKKLPSNPGE